MKQMKIDKHILFIIIALIFFAVISLYAIRKRDEEHGYNSNREYLPEIPEVYEFRLPIMVSTLMDEMGFDSKSETVVTKLPSMVNLKYNIASQGKDKVFPITLTKITDGVIELPLKLSLLEKGYPYKHIDIEPDSDITVVAIKDLTYSVDGQVFFDTFLITDKDYLIAYSAAYENFGIK